MPPAKKPKSAVTTLGKLENEKDLPTTSVNGAEKIKKGRTKKIEEKRDGEVSDLGVAAPKGRGGRKAKAGATSEIVTNGKLTTEAVEESNGTAKVEIVKNGGDLAKAAKPTRLRPKRAAETENVPVKQDEKTKALKNGDAKTKATRGGGNKKIETTNDVADVTEALEVKPSSTAAKGRKAKEASVEPSAAAPRRGRKRNAAEATTTVEPTEAVNSKTVKEAKTVAEPRRKTAKKPIKEAVAQNVLEEEETAKPKTSRKRGATKTVATELADGDNDEAAEAKPTKAKKALLNPTETTYNKTDFELGDVDNNLSNVSNGSVERKQLKISSWNVAGLRSWLKKDGLKFLEFEDPDIFCLQEIKCTVDQMPEEAKRIPGYHPYWLCLPGGYAGVALYSKIMPINVEYGIDDPDFDDAGRLITAEYEKFFLICVYVPNSGRKLINLDARMRWEKLFQAHVKKYDARKPVIICGDMNVSHQEIDLANPKSNTRSAGFTIEEREKMTELLTSLHLIDTFRQMYPKKIGAYTYWTYMGNARSRNVGWRLDYFIVSERIGNRVIENAIRSQVMGSDHCPITLFVNM